MKFITRTELYLTFLTHNDSYMQKIAIGEELELIDGDLAYKGKRSIDDHHGYLYHKFIEEIKG